MKREWKIVYEEPGYIVIWDQYLDTSWCDFVGDGARLRLMSSHRYAGATTIAASRNVINLHRAAQLQKIEKIHNL